MVLDTNKGEKTCKAIALLSITNPTIARKANGRDGAREKAVSKRKRIKFSRAQFNEKKLNEQNRCTF